MSIRTASCPPSLRIAAACAVALLTACTNVTNPPPVAAVAPAVVITPAAAPATPVYTVKSGSYDQLNPATPTVKTTVYFDDYGRKTSTHTVTESGGKKTTTVVYNNNDGWITTYVDGSPTASRVKYVAAPAPTYYSYPVADRKVIEVVEIGGVKCEGWVVTENGVDTRVWTYKGIPCKVEAGQNVVLQTTNIKEEVPSTTIFTLPATVTVQDN